MIVTGIDPFSQTWRRDGVLNEPRELGVKPIDGTTVLVSMTDDQCPCCGGIENSNAESERSENRWISGASPLESELPPELQSALRRFLGVESVETLGGWASEVRDRTGGGSITVDDLCLTDEETVHRGTVGDEQYHFACFYDAVILAALSDSPVDVWTKSPDGTVIEARAVGTEELTVRPSEAVFSFGIDDAVAPPADGEDPSLERGYAAICPYVNAFPTPVVYEEWAKSVSAATVAMPLEGATDLAAELVR